VFLQLLEHITYGIDHPETTGFAIENLESMMQNFQTYWPKLEESSLVAMIIDPRYKLDAIKDKYKKKASREKFDKIFCKYEEKNTAQALSSASTQTQPPSTSSTLKAKSTNPGQILAKKFKEKILPLAQRLFTDSNSRVSQKSEIINYFSEPRIVNPEEDILKWWKTNQTRFPVLSKIARDYLAAQATSVPSERGFSKSGLTVTDLRNSLHNETVRCLMCLNSLFKLDFELK